MDVCSWDKPGADPYTGKTEAAIHRYADIPSAVQQELISKIKRKEITDVAFITKDETYGRDRYSDLRQMHFGKNRVCNRVSTAQWTSSQTEVGLVYCIEEYCVIIPMVCGNVSRITRHTKSPDTGTSEWVPTPEQRNAPAQSVPEPSTMLLVGAAIIGLMALRKQR